jgi:TonB family protein
MLQDRFPLNREDLDQVWDVLLPLGTGSVPVVVASPGSTQDRLDLEFGLAKTPATGTVTAESALRTAAAGSPARLAEVVPFPAASLAAETRVMETSQPTRRVTPVEDLDSTWSSRPMRTAMPAETPAPTPASPEPLAAGAPPRSRPLWINAGAAAGILLALAAGGLWWSRRPAPEALPPSPPPAVSTTIATVKSPAVSVPIPAAAPIPAPVVPARPPVSPPVSNPALEAPRPKPPAPGPALAEQRPPALREPLPEEPAPAVATEEAMKPGDLIRAGQPGVQPPEIRALPSYVYPAAAKGSGRKVSVRLAVLVDENGRVIDARVREGDKPGLGFDEAALEAARKARYFPATRGDVPGKMWTDLRIDFAE